MQSYDADATFIFRDLEDLVNRRQFGIPGNFVCFRLSWNNGWNNAQLLGDVAMIRLGLP
jgi:hypothetical protein